MLTNPITAKVIFFVSLFAFVFYLIIYFIVSDVYKYPIVGGFYELLALPMLTCLLLIPIVSVLIVIKNKGNARIYAILSIILTACSILTIVLANEPSI